VLPPLGVPAQLTLAADTESLAGPGAAAGCARLKAVVAGKAQDLQVLIAVVAAPQHGQSVMNLERALAARCSADLAGSAAGGYQRPPSRIGQRHDAGPPVAGAKDAVARASGADQRRESALAAGRAFAAQDDQVGDRAATAVRDSKDIQSPGPFEPAALAGPRAPALERDANTRSKAQSPKHAFASAIVALTNGARRLGFRVEDGQRDLDRLFVPRPGGRAGSAVPRRQEEERSLP